MQDQHEGEAGIRTAPAVELPNGVADNVGLTVLTLLRKYGVDDVFGIPGTHNLEFYRHVAPLDIRAVTSRHEQGAAAAPTAGRSRAGCPAS